MHPVIPGTVIALVAATGCLNAANAAADTANQLTAANRPEASHPPGPATGATKATPHKAKPRVRYSIPPRKKS
jgi:hypothetical protein